MAIIPSHPSAVQTIIQHNHTPSQVEALHFLTDQGRNLGPIKFCQRISDELLDRAVRGSWKSVNHENHGPDNYPTQPNNHDE